MIALNTKKSKLSIIDRHSYICELINIEGPILTLYRDTRKNWLYLWADTDGKSQRWLVFDVSRADLIDYLSKLKSLRTLVIDAKNLYCLEVNPKTSNTLSRKNGEQSRPNTEITHYTRHLYTVQSSQVEEYLPTVDAFFDETLTDEISLAAELQPTRYSIPIDGEWFFSDLDRFSRGYAGLYAFFYCTGPRFVTSVGTRLYKSLRSPWQGGFSRINLFDGLVKSIPSLHDMQVKKIHYASPGAIQIEALASVGSDIKKTVFNAIKNKSDIEKSTREINTILSKLKLKRMDLSEKTDKDIAIDQSILDRLKLNISNIANQLQAESQIKVIGNHSPNTVVTAKATIALVIQLNRIADYQNQGMIDLEKFNFDGIDIK